MHDRAALDNGDQPQQPQRPVGRHVHPGRGRHPAVLLGADRDASPGARRGRARPADLGGRGVQHGNEPLVVQVPAPELDRVGARRRGQFVHDRLAGEIIGRRRERAVGALRERRRGRLVFQVLMRHPVGRRQAAAPELMLVTDQPASAPVPSQLAAMSITAAGRR